MAVFLWHIDRIAFRRSLLTERPAELPTPREEFLASLACDEKIVADDNPLRRQRIGLDTYALSVYLAATGDQDGAAAYLRDAKGAFQDSRSVTRFHGLEIDRRTMIGKLLIRVELPQEAAGLLKDVVDEDQRQWLAWWFRGRANEALYHPEEAFDSFWKAAEGYQSSVYFSHLRSILGGWCVPSEDPGFWLSGAPPGFMRSRGTREYKFRILESELPQTTELAGIKDAATREWLTRFSDHCHRLKAGLEADGWDLATIKDRMLACSKKAYELDMDGALNLKNVTDYAYDLMQAGQFGEARDLFKKALDLEEKAGHKPCFSLWQTGECMARLSGVITLESAKYFIRSAALENTDPAYRQLRRKLRDGYTGDGEELANLFLDIFDEHEQYASGLLIENLIPACLERIWERGDVVSQEMLRRLTAFATAHPFREAIAAIAVALQWNRTSSFALPYFEKLDKLDELPSYVLVSYISCLRYLGDPRFRGVSGILGRRRHGR
jgi:tetratricopeptide (TPR) repeat protein